MLKLAICLIILFGSIGIYWIIGTAASFFLIHAFNLLSKDKEARVTWLWPFYCFLVWFAIIKVMFGQSKTIKDEVVVRKECTKDHPFPGQRKENEVWTHVDADWTDDDTGRFLKCPNCGITIDLGPDVV